MSPGGRRDTVARRLALASVGVVVVTLTASGAAHRARTRQTAAIQRPEQSSATNHLTAASRLPALPPLPARGAGAALTKAAYPAAVVAPGAATITGGSAGIPATVLAAYRKAAASLAVAAPGCRLTWPLLAGIGKVETDHGRSWGSASRITAMASPTPTTSGTRP